MTLSEKTPIRMVQVSLFFSLANFVMSGVDGKSILFFLVFTCSVFVLTKIFMLLEHIQNISATDMSELRFYLFWTAILFIGIATLAYSPIFGIFYGLVMGVYLISPYDRDWLAGNSNLVIYDNKVEYRKVKV